MSIITDTDLRHLLGPARDQGRRPTCLAFAVSAVHEGSRGAVEYLSTEHLFFRAVQRSHGNPRRGLNKAAVTDALKHDGQPLEEAWPYLIDLRDTSSWAPPAEMGALHRATIVFESRTVSEIRSAIQAGKPVVLLVSVTTAMYRPDTAGVVRGGSSDVTTTNRHALVAVGSGHAFDGAYILVRNSWGLSWGDQGHAWLPDAYLAAQLHATGIIS